MIKWFKKQPTPTKVMIFIGLFFILCIFSCCGNIIYDGNKLAIETPVIHDSTATSVMNVKSTNKPTKKPTVKPTKKPTEKPTVKPTKKITYDTSITYDQLARTPDKYTGKGVVFTGEIVQIIKESTIDTLRIAIDNNYDKIAICNYAYEDNEEYLLEGDVIRFNGVSLGLYTYESTFGQSITIPWIVIDKIIER